jgi:hypothetical protein
VPDRVRDPPIPFKAKVAIARSHRQPRDLSRGDAWSVHVELPVAETISKTTERAISSAPNTPV